MIDFKYSISSYECNTDNYFIHIKKYKNYWGWHINDKLLGGSCKTIKSSGSKTLKLAKEEIVKFIGEYEKQND